jgi:phospholipase A-2-activating protein
VPLNNHQILENLGLLPYTLLNKTQRVAFATILFKCVVMFSQLPVRLIFFNSISCTMHHTSIDTTLQDTYITLILGVRPGACFLKVAH